MKANLSPKLELDGHGSIVFRLQGTYLMGSYANRTWVSSWPLVKEGSLWSE